MDPEILAQIMQMFGNGLGGIFSHYRNPSKSAMGYLNQLGPEASSQFGPYIGAGESQIPGLERTYGGMAGELPNIEGSFGNMAGGLPGVQTAYGNLASTLPGISSQIGKMMSNPGQFINQIGKGYQESPGFEFAKNQATDAANRAASAGGYIGSPQEQLQLGKAITGMANQDYGNWLDRALGENREALQSGIGLGEFGLEGGERLGQTGLQGESGLFERGLGGEEGLNQMGFDANTQLANMIRDALMSQANLSYAGQENQNRQNADRNASIFGGLGGLLGHFLGRG